MTLKITQADDIAPENGLRFGGVGHTELPVLVDSQVFTLETTFIRRGDNVAWDRILTGVTANNYTAYTISFESTGKVYFVSRYADDSNYYNLVPVFIPAIGERVHFAVTCDGSTIRLYINGVLYETDTLSKPLMAAVGFYLSKHHFNNSNYFPGDILDVRTWNVARTQEEIKQYKDIPLVGNEPGLTAYYPFSEMTGSILGDHAGPFTYVTDPLNLATDPDFTLSDTVDDKEYWNYKVAETEWGSSYGENGTPGMRMWGIVTYNQLQISVNGVNKQIPAQVGDTFYCQARVKKEAILDTTSAHFVAWTYDDTGSYNSADQDGVTAQLVDDTWITVEAEINITRVGTVYVEIGLQIANGTQGYLYVDSMYIGRRPFGPADGTIVDAEWVDAVEGVLENVEPDGTGGLQIEEITNGISFDGVNDYISCGVIPAGNTVTVSCWAKVLETADYFPLLSTYNGSTGHHFIFGSNLGVFALFLDDNVTGEWQQTAVDIRGSAVYRHFAFSYDNATKECKIYLDGTLVLQSTYSHGSVGMFDYTFHIGGSPPWSEYTETYIKDVQIWSRVLTEAEIQDNMYPNLTGNEIALVAWIPLTDGTFNDHAGDNHGTLYGGSWVLNGQGSRTTAPIDLSPVQNADNIKLDWEGYYDVDLTPYMGGYENAEGKVTASAYHSSNYYPWEAFKHENNDNKDCWITPDPANLPQWLAYEFKTGPKSVRKYTIAPRWDSTNHGPPEAWTFEGSNDGVNWDVLHTVTGQLATEWPYTEIRTFDMGETYTYSHFRIRVTAKSSTWPWCAIGEMELISGLHHAESKDTNVALGAAVTASCTPTGGTLANYTDGNLDDAAANRLDLSTGLLEYAQVDLGVIYTLNLIKVWFYYGDSRSYLETTLEVSEDGTNWFTVFDPVVEGEYVSYSYGKAHKFEPRNVRHIRQWVNGSTSNAGSHLVELQAFESLQPLLVESRLSTDGGTNWTSWSQAERNQALANLTPGQDVTSGLLEVRQSFTTDDPTVSPLLESMDATVVGSSETSDILVYNLNNEVEENTVKTSDVWSWDVAEQAIINAALTSTETLTLVLSDSSTKLVGGQRESVEYDLSVLDDITYGTIEWRQNLNDQKILIESSFTLDGVNWTPWEVCINRLRIPSLLSIEDTSNVKLKIRQKLFSYDGVTSPVLFDVVVRVFSSVQRAVLEEGADSTAAGTANDVMTGSGRAVEQHGATNDQDLRHSEDTTMIDGGKIFAGSSVQIGNLDGISDYCRIDDGDIKFYQYLGGDHRLTKSLKRIESGICENDTECLLSGYWAETPYVIVSPHSLEVYNNAYSSQSQRMVCDHVTVDPQVTPGMYKFTPKAELHLSEGVASHTVNKTGDWQYSWNGAAVHSYTSKTGLNANIEGLGVTVTLQGYLYRRYTTMEYYSWVNLKARARILDDSGWSSWIYSGLITLQNGQTKVSTLSFGTSGYSNISDIQVDVFYSGFGHSSSNGDFTIHCCSGIQLYTAYYSQAQVLADGTLNYIAISQ